jgi:hypothetical protein
MRFVSSINSRKPNEAKVQENSSSAGYAKILLDECSESSSSSATANNTFYVVIILLLEQDVVSIVQQFICRLPKRIMKSV